jgi:hypothetical protein
MGMASHSRQALVVILLLCAVVAQCAARDFETVHHNASQHCCLLCHIGPLPFVQAAVASTAEPSVAIAWLPVIRHRPGKHEVSLLTDSSRAPPSTSSVSL